MTSICSKCKAEKHVSEFPSDKNRPAGVSSWCVDCKREYDRLRHANPKNKESKKHYLPVSGTRVVCRDCGEEKDESLFDLASSNITGRSYQCKECRSAYHRILLEQKKPGVKRAGEGKLSEEEKAERRRIAQRIYRSENQEEVNRRAREGNKARRKTDPNFAIKTQLTNRLGDAVRNGQKAGSGLRDLGCSIEELRAHLESKFQPRMTWENRGHGFGKWNIDHIVPLAAFDLTNRQHVLLACNYLNLQPLWHEENMSKGDKYSSHFELG